jgi:rhodanese-related sulfurtransferase
MYVIEEIMKRLIIDVREPEEYQISHIAGALNIPSTRLSEGANDLANTPKDTEIILYCLSGNRSNVCINILKGLGFTTVKNGINQEQVKAKYL